MAERKSLFSAGHLLLATQTRERVVRIERRVQLFKNGPDKAIAIPRAFGPRAEGAAARNETELLIGAPAAQYASALLATLQPLPEDFPPIRASTRTG